MNKTGEVKERGVFWLLFNNEEPQESKDDIIKTSKEREELEASEERIKKMIDKYKIENFESFGVIKKTPRIKKSQANQTIQQKEKAETQLEQEGKER